MTQLSKQTDKQTGLVVGGSKVPLVPRLSKQIDRTGGAPCESDEKLFKMTKTVFIGGKRINNMLALGQGMTRGMTLELGRFHSYDI